MLNVCRFRKQWIFVNNKSHVNWQNKTKYENKQTKETYQDDNHKNLWRWWLDNVLQNDVQCLQKTFDDHNNIKEKEKEKDIDMLFCLNEYYINNKTKKKRKKKLKLMMVITKYVFLMNDELRENNYCDDELEKEIRFYNFHIKIEKNVKINLQKEKKL